MASCRPRSARRALARLWLLLLAAGPCSSLAAGSEPPLDLDPAALAREARYDSSVSVGSPYLSDNAGPPAVLAAAARYDNSVTVRSESVRAWQSRRRTVPGDVTPSGTGESGQFLGGEWVSVLGTEGRLFFHSPAFPRQARNDISLFFTTEYKGYWEDGRQSLTFVPFARLDSADSERSHVDIRELIWRRSLDTWGLGVGFGKVFWGVTESQHLVDIVNQTDLVENIDGEDKLGQPMINLSLYSPFGDLDLFALTGFRERTFPGPEGRLRFSPPVDGNQAEFESSHGRAHVDFAARWSHAVGPWDLGLSYFWGTTRDPAFIPGFDSGGSPRLIPLYEIISQGGLDAQLTLGSWAWKLESVYRSGQGHDWLAATGGFEYSLYGILGSAADLGLILEYLYADERVNVPTPFPNDFFVGLRLHLNDVQGTRVLAGVYQNRDGEGTLVNLEAGRRFGDYWRLDLEMRFFHDYPPGNVLFFVQEDDYVGLTLSRYF